jgi:hypothetical protein
MYDMLASQDMRMVYTCFTFHRFCPYFVLSAQIAWTYFKRAKLSYHQSGIMLASNDQ